jgi:UDP-GlcNAc:undecaprenyl-phosphate GlcNAc-1-phosphate transferase
MDGLATTVALGCAFSYLVIAYLFQQDQVILLLIAFIGSLLAFLWYNKPRAKIYLGDAGSLFVGGFFSALPFFFPWSRFHTLAFLTPVIVLAIPLFEISSLICIRSWKKIPFYRGSPDHFCHYFQRLNWSIPWILMSVATLNIAMLGLSFAFLFNLVSFATLLIVATTFFATWLMSVVCFWSK